MINKFRKAFSCIIVLSMFLFTSCDSKPTIYELAREDADKIIELIKNKDVKQLSEMFSNEVKQKHNLEEEWQILFDSIDGNIVGYDSIEYGAEEEGWDKEGNLYKQSISIGLINPKTDSGKTYYKIVYCQTMVDSQNPDREGLWEFRFGLNENDDADKIIKIGCD